MIDHNSMRSYLSILPRLKKIAFTRDSYKQPMFASDTSHETYYSDLFPSHEEMDAAGLDWESEEASTQVWEERHKRRMDDEDPRPTKRRKPLSALAVTTPFHVPQSRPLVSPSTANLEIDDVQPQADHGCPSPLVDDEQHDASRTSRSPSMATAAVLVAEYKEWSFHGILRRTKIGDDTMFKLEFKLPSILEHLSLPINLEALATCSSREALSKPLVADEAATHSKIYQPSSWPPKRRALWTSEEDATLVELLMERDLCGPA